MSQSWFYRYHFIHDTLTSQRQEQRDNRSLDFVQTLGVISFINNNHVDNNLKEILVYVFFG